MHSHDYNTVILHTYMYMYIAGPINTVLHIYVHTVCTCTYIHVYFRHNRSVSAQATVLHVHVHVQGMPLHSCISLTSGGNLHYVIVVHTCTCTSHCCTYMYCMSPGARREPQQSVINKMYANTATQFQATGIQCVHVHTYVHNVHRYKYTSD